MPNADADAQCEWTLSCEITMSMIPFCNKSGEGFTSEIISASTGSADNMNGH